MLVPPGASATIPGPENRPSVLLLLMLLWVALLLRGILRRLRCLSPLATALLVGVLRRRVAATPAHGNHAAWLLPRPRCAAIVWLVLLRGMP